MENEVGVPLLRRTTRHVALTAAGEAFLAEIRKSLFLYRFGQVFAGDSDHVPVAHGFVVMG
ncbi:hypothetical protein [Halosaccharopolyspora lacisalsi]|nr:hypothetical protein [Halosaccharopolyspora lacisalsi]